MEQRDNVKNVLRSSDVYKDFITLYKEQRFSMRNPNSLRNTRVTLDDVRNQKDKVLTLIREVESFGKDMSDERERLDVMQKEMINFSLYFELENLYKELSLKYGKYVSEKNILKYILNNLEDISFVELNSFVTLFLERIKILKDDDIFLDGGYYKYIELFYKVGYKLMKMEFIYSGKSRLFDYFIKFPHDVFIINELLGEEIEELRLSINHINGRELLDKETQESGTYLNESVIMAFMFCSEANDFEYHFRRNLHDFKYRFSKIYHLIHNINFKFKTTRPFNKSDVIQYIKKKNELVKSYNSLYKEYHDFLNYYALILDNDLLSIGYDGPGDLILLIRKEK